ncbi:hypothetical protein Slin15195_G007770 [Septoria linicola]|uniref:Uncharacterized protein n=1 Tax=Septoria linicola TaxID=215465 RepID=A0A9Q9AJT5_9PEZI|nr:hypothetical protein Slin14017_G007780 [Septoria linicola]USW47458.1 hypothetical protein Slin15195_G007770 [Septoria linicola]
MVYRYWVGCAFAHLPVPKKRTGQGTYKYAGPVHDQLSTPQEVFDAEASLTYHLIFEEHFCIIAIACIVERMRDLVHKEARYCQVGSSLKFQAM